MDTLDIGSSSIRGAENNPLHIASDSEYHYPVSDDMFDVVISGQVMEHVRKIWLWIDELKRIVRPNGLIIIVVPVSWTYHEFPADCWRIYPDRMRALLEDKGLDIIECNFESLEKKMLPKSTPTIPGDATIDIRRATSRPKRLLIACNWLVDKFPPLRGLTIPLIVAYDTFCVCGKSLTGNLHLHGHLLSSTD